MREINKIILHCSASSVIGQRIVHIKAWHTKPPPDGNGWSDVGYHFFIGFDGLLEQGRPVEKAGAHAQGHNKDSIGICLAGLRMTDFTAKQFDSLSTLLLLLKRSYPHAKLLGHSEVDQHGKTCPVFDVVPWKKFWELADGSLPAPSYSA